MTFPPQQPPPPNGYRPGSPPPPAMGPGGAYGPAGQPGSPPPQTMGPGGAYGPAGGPAGQPVPGQMPPPSMTMSKPGTITGIQAILWIFLAIGAVGDVFTIINMIDLFQPLMLIPLAYALYTTIQSVLTPVHIARGKRWAWIWNLVSAILGLLFACVGIVFGIIFIDTTVIPLLFGLVFAALDGTLLGLLCSKSARQWILMHRIQRGEVQVAGMPGAMGGMQGAVGAPQPERPATRPGAATFAVIVVWLFAALCAWGAWTLIDRAMDMDARYEFMSLPGAFLDHRNLWWVGIPTVMHVVLLICAVICAPGLMKGAAGARIFGVVWSIGAVLMAGFLLVLVFLDYRDNSEFLLPWAPNPYPMMFARQGALQVLAIAILVLMLVPGVKKWTPRKPPMAIVMTVPMGQPGMGTQAPQGYAPQQPQQGYPQQPQY